MKMESGAKRPKYWNQVEEQLSKLGYTLKRKLSNNGSESKSSPSEVWLAEHKTSDRSLEEVALKLSSQVFSILSGTDADDLKKLDEHTQREISIMERVHHPNIPHFVGYHRLSYGDIATVDALAMQYIPMPNVLDGMKKKKLQEPQAKKLLEDILSALDHVHTGLDEQVLHRDIKPSNILFDGNKAFLFDFNFSKIGDVTSSSTFVDNHGYYPADTYLGRQTQSQDLVALGNTVIAAALGKEIGDIRYEQGKNGLGPVDVSIDAFSPKMQGFLRNLIAENPAFRYQSAAQALQDLKNLEQLTEEQLEKKSATIIRSKGLEKLLSALKKRDRLFEHNVPSAIRTRYDDDRLLEYLESTYAQGTFIIENPEDVREYANPGDRVVKRGEFNTILVDTGEIVKVDLLDWESTAVNTRLINKGRNINIPKLHLKQIGGFINVKAKYDGPPIPDPEGISVPDQAEGIIIDGPRSKGYAIAWANTPNLRYKLKGMYSGQDGFGYKPPVFFGEDHFRLVIPNHINYRDLHMQCFSEEQKQLPKSTEKDGKKMDRK